jgi:hypothetical protein
VWNGGAKVISLEPSQDFESRSGERLRRAYEISRDRESTVREIESRRFESLRVREFELYSGVIPTVKSETNKESEITEWLSPLFPTSTATTVQYYAREMKEAFLFTSCVKEI